MSLVDLLVLVGVEVPTWAAWLSQSSCGDIYAHEFVPVLDEQYGGYTCVDMQGKETCIITSSDIYDKTGALELFGDKKERI